MGSGAMFMEAHASQGTFLNILGPIHGSGGEPCCAGAPGSFQNSKPVRSARAGVARGQRARKSGSEMQASAVEEGMSPNPPPPAAAPSLLLLLLLPTLGGPERAPRWA
eukprot:7813417-Pyramimonas_sp.AAC.1